MESKSDKVGLSSVDRAIVFFIIVLFIHISEGVRCWTCENAISNDDCIARGRSVDCYSDGMGCSSEVRYHAGFVFKIQIRKGCKQILACGSDKSQNGHGWYPVQCNPKFPDSICRCCCQTEGCNKNLIGCEPPQPDCRNLLTPKNGYKICNNEAHPTALRSICTFFCKRGYEMEGDHMTECVKTKNGRASWTLKEPRCITKKCKPQYKSTPARRVQCTDKNDAGSVCTFTCAKGHTMNGEPRSTCLFSKNWDYPPPDCVKITCPPPIIPPENSVMSCTNGLEYESVCRYTCETGYVLLGNGVRKCVLSNTPDNAYGVWSGSLPTCAAITCEPKQINPSFGSVECTDLNYIGSTCTYECKEDYVLEGSDSNSCVWNKTSGSGNWNSEPPVCTPTRCPMLAKNLTNGQISCSNENNVGSMCALSCNAGSFIQLPSDPDMILYGWIVSCLYGGRWSQEPAACVQISCIPDFSSEGIEEGTVLCSDGNNHQSECGFSCREGFDLVGKDSLVCTGGGPPPHRGSWDSDPPKCIRSGCPAVSRSNREMKVSCTKRYEEGSVCSFSCKAGTFMSLENSVPHEDSDYSIECLEGQQWSGAVPVCIQIRCDPPFGALPNGVMKCSNGNKYKSRCASSCNVAYGLEGSSTAYCSENPHIYGEGKWSKPKPECVRNGCAPRFVAPIDGRISCTKKNLFKSECTFSCDAGNYMKSFDNYLIESNSLAIRCSTEGDWSQIPPTCHPIVCKPPNKDIINGNVTCSNGNKYKSKCKHVCKEGYEVNKITDTAVCTDKLTSSAFGQWSHNDFKCRRATCTLRQRAPNGGKVACSSGNGVGSDCIFICYEGYYMNTTDGTVLPQNKFEVKCQKNKKWTATAPQCLPVTCPKRIFPNGDVSCTNENRYLSTCRFYCLPGYKLQGTNTTRCVGGKAGASAGRWSIEWPTCEELQCDSRSITPPKNGFVLCSDGARLRSTCEFVCDVGYSLVGEQFIICEANAGFPMKWNSPPPRCKKDIK